MSDDNEEKTAEEIIAEANEAAKAVNSLIGDRLEGNSEEIGMLIMLKIQYFMMKKYEMEGAKGIKMGILFIEDGLRERG